MPLAGHSHLHTSTAFGTRLHQSSRCSSIPQAATQLFERCAGRQTMLLHAVRIWRLQAQHLMAAHGTMPRGAHVCSSLPDPATCRPSSVAELPRAELSAWLALLLSPSCESRLRPAALMHLHEVWHPCSSTLCSPSCWQMNVSAGSE